MTLNINNLSKKFGENAVVKNVSFSVEKGEIFGLFGTSGAGKSALIEAVANGEINSGSISIDGEDVSRVNRKERNFRLISKTIENSGDFFDDKKQEFEIENLIKTGAQVLLLDNLFCCLDEARREETLSKLRETVRAKNLAVIFATNNFNEIFSACDRVAMLENGEIKQTGTPRSVYENPHSAVIAAATGRCNLIEAKCLNSDDCDTSEFQTLIGGHKIYSDKNAKTAFDGANQNLTLAIRPEHISISFGASFPEDNLVRARISGVKYQGATTLIELDAGGLKLEALVLRLVGLKIGDECMVGLPPGRILVFNN